MFTRIMGMVLMAVAGGVLCVQAEIYTYGLVQSVEKNYTGYYGYFYGEYELDTFFLEQQIQEVQLRDVSIDIKPHGSYLEITEDAVISPAALVGDYLRYWIEGVLTLPGKSTITAMYLYADTGAYAARIQPIAMIDSAVDTTRGKMIASLGWVSNEQYWTGDGNGQPILASRNYYSMKIDTIENGKEYRMIIKYLVPNNGKPDAVYSLSVLHHSNFQHPGVFELTFTTDSAAPPYVLTVNNMNFQLRNNQSIQIPYQREFTISAKTGASSTMHLSKIDDGAWKGNYLLLNTSIPDSVLKQLGVPIEVAVLWRWNSPHSFVVRPAAEEGNAYLSLYGYQATSQARAIRLLFDEITSGGNRAGLVHSIQSEKPEIFPLCRKNSSAYSRIESYLNQFSTEYFLDSKYYSCKSIPEQKGNDDTAAADSSGKEFVDGVQLVHGLYSNEAGVLKHLIILSCGPARMSRNMITLEEVDSLFGDLTVDCGNAVWTDVSFPAVKSKARNDPLYALGSFQVPEFRPYSLMLNVSNTAKEYSFPLSPNQASFSIIAKAAGSWNPVLTWVGYNRSGAVMNTVTAMAGMYQKERDTGLVKLWAANNERLNETKESNIEKTYGIVSQMYSLKIYPSYQGYGTDVVAYAEVEPVYAPEGPPTAVALPDKTVQVGADKRFICSCDAHGVRIILPENEAARQIKIYSLAGKLLLELDPARFKNAGGYFLPESYLSRYMTARNIVIIRIEGVRHVWNRQQVIYR